MMLSDSQFDAAAQAVVQPDTDPIDRAAQQVAGDRKTQLRASLYSSLMSNPDMAARAQRLGRKTGLPGDVVERNLPEVERSAALTDIDRALEGSPLLAQWMADPKNARVSHDDVPQMGAIEAAVKWLVSAPGAPRGGLTADAGNAGLSLLKGAIAVPQAAVGLADIPTLGRAGMAAEYLGIRFKESQSILDGLYSDVQQNANREVRDARGFTGTLGAMLSNPSTILHAGLESAPSMLGGASIARGLLGIGGRSLAAGVAGPALPGFLARRFGAAAPLIAGAAGEGFVGAGSAAEQYRESGGGLTVGQVAAAIASGAGTGALSILGGKVAQKLGITDMDTALAGGVLKPADVKHGLARTLAEAGVSEGLLEEMPQSAQERIWQNIATDRPALEGVPEAAAQGLIAGAAMGGSFAGAARRIDADGRRAQLAEQHGQALADVSKLIEASKLRQRDPEAFATFAQSLTEEGVSSLYVDARALQQSGVDLQALAQAMPSVAQQIEQAAATGGDVVIPTAEFLTQAPGQEWSAALIDHARTGADAMSPAGAREYMQAHGEQLQEEIARTIEQHATDTEWQAGRDAVRGEFQRQLDEVGRWQPEVNRQYAALLGDYYAATAARAGMTPQELAARYPLRIQAKAPDGSVNAMEQVDTLPKLRASTVEASKAFYAMDARAASGEQVDPDEYMRLADEQSSAQDALSAGIAAIPDEAFGLQAATRDGRMLVLNASAQQPGKWQLTRFDKDGVPFMDTQHDTKLSAVKEFVHESDPSSIKSFDQTLNQSAKLPATIDIDGQQLSTTNSKGQPIAATEEGVRAFWRWFGDSKVVDADGRPLVVYHGTRGDFSTFGNVGGRFKVSKGFYFTSREEHANTYADHLANAMVGWNYQSQFSRPVEIGANVMPVYVRAANPLRVTDKDGPFNEPEAAFDYQGGVLVSSAKELGHDGVLYSRDKGDGYDSSAVVVFAPDQIKSATGNRGTFDPNDASILNQSARGQIAFGQDLTHAPSVISLFDGADWSTLIHEAGHFFLEAHMDLAGRIAGRIADGEQVSDGERGIVADANALLGWFGVKGDEQAGGVAGGALMQNGAVRPHEAAAQEIADAIAKDRETDPFAEYALRVIPGEYTEPIEPGDMLPPSKLWVDGEQTDEDLEGTSGAHVKGDDAESVLKALRDLGATGKNGPNGFYFGDRVVLIKAERAIPGEDVGEALLPGAEVVGTWRKPSKGLSEVQSNDQSAPASLGVLNQGGQPDARPEPPPIGRTPLETWAMMSIDQKRAFHEQFARGFELYALEGKAPSLSLQSVFQRFSVWLKSVYRSITQRSAEDVLQVTLTDEVRQVMDRMIATDEQIAEAQAMREMGPLFGGADQAGMTPEQWAQYHELAAQATAQASEQLQARGLRDMQWLRNARSRELKRLQDRAAGLRREVEMEVRREVLSTPIYRAWQFLTTKGDAQATAQPTPRVRASGALDPASDNLFTAIAKLGGLDRAEVVGAWGVDPKDRLESGVFGTPVLRKEGGLSIDAMAEKLAEEGYLLRDENGRTDPADLESAFDSQRRGVDQFSTWHDLTEDARVRAYTGADVPEALPDEILHGKLDTAVLRDMYGTKPDALWRTLSTRRMTSEASGIHPEVVAETFGYDSADALVRALAAADPPRQVIEGLTDQRMLERYGDLATPEGLQREADKAIHNEARARAIATELDALEKMGKVRSGEPRTADVLAKAARDYAAAVIGAKKVRDIRPGEYTAAEARASKAAQKAFKSGDTQTAAAEKRNQLIQHAAAKAALQAREEVEKAVEYLRRMAKRPKGLDAGYADQIDQLLERFDLKPISNKELARRESLIDWLEGKPDETGSRSGGIREQGLAPDIAPELLNEAARTSWRNLTLDELRGLRDAVKQIEHLGRLKGKLLASKAKRDFEAVRDELADSIEANSRGRTAGTRTPATVLGRRLAAIKRFGAAHIKAATWARIFDGGRDGGPVWEYLIRGANVAGDFETTRRAQATEALTKILAPVMKSSKLHRKAQYASVNRSLTREQVLVMALNTGNDGNWQRMLDGEGWTRPQVMAVLNTLTATEWQAVQGVWDHMESYRPEIGAKEKRVYGKEPEWVQAVPLLVDTADGQRLTLRGGYFPIKYDPAANAQAEQHADAEDAKQMMRGAYTSATTRRGFTKSRVQEVKSRPLMYSLGAVYGGVQDVIHDLAWHEWLIDTNKLLRSTKVDGAIRQHYGPEVVRQFKEWVRDVAAGDRPQQAAVDEVLSRIRRGVSMAGLGFNVMSAAMQPLGLTQSIVRVGAPWVARGVAQYIANPLAATRRVVAASDFMAGRSRTRFRELNELRNQIEGESGAMQWVNRNAFWLMLRAQQAVDVPTWLGAYEKAISEGVDEARAVALADQAVLDAQGGGQVKDQAGIERGGPAQKLFTVFYSFMNTALNAGVAQTMTADTRAKKAKLAVDLLLLYTVPAVLGAMLKDALTPGDSGDDEPEELAKKLAAAQLDYLMGLFMLVRETTESVKIVAGLTDRPRDYAGPAGLRLIPDAVAFAKQARQAWSDGELDDAFRKAAVNLTGDLFGLPAAQVNRTITGAMALADDETDNPAALVFGFQKEK